MSSPRRRRTPRAAPAFAAVVVVAGADACLLSTYESGTITCSTSGTAAPCPDGFACLNPHHEAQSTCVRVGCGDGVIDPTTEQCDDANDNALDLCGGASSSCRVAHFEATPVVGLGVATTAADAIALGQPDAVSAAGDGSIYLAAFGTNLVRRLDADGALTTFAGNGSIVDVSDGGGSDAGRAVLPHEIATPFTSAIAVDGFGNVFLADLQRAVVRRIDAIDGSVTTVVRARAPDEAGGVDELVVPTTTLPSGITTDGDGALVYVDYDTVTTSGGERHRVRRVDPQTGHATTLWSGEAPGNVIGNVDDAEFDDEGTLVALGENGIVRLRRGDDEAHAQQLLLDLSPGSACLPTVGAQRHVALSADGRSGFYAAGNTVLRFAIDDDATSLACDVLGVVPDAPLDALPVLGGYNQPGPLDIAWRMKGDAPTLLLADPANGVVWEMPADGASASPHVVAGVRRDDAGSDLAQNLIVQLAEQTDGRITLSETTHCRTPTTQAERLTRENLEVFGAFPDVHRVFTVGCDDVITVLAGDGTAGFGGDDGDPQRAALHNPVGAVRGRNGRIYIADRDNNAIRVVDEADVTTNPPRPARIATFVGPDDVVVDGQALLRPAGIAVDDSGSLIVSDSGHGRIVRIPVDDPGHSTVLLDGLLGPEALVYLPYAFSSDLVAFTPGCNVPAGTLTQDPCGILVYVERGGHRLRAQLLAPFPAALAGYPDGSIDLAGAAGDDPAPIASDDDDIDADEATRAGFRFPRGLMLDIPAVLDPANTDSLQPNLLVVDAFDRLRRVHMISSFNLLANPPLVMHATVETVTSRHDDPPVGHGSRSDADDDSGQLRGPTALVAWSATRLFVLDQVSGRLRVLDVDTGALHTVAGLPEGDDVVAGAPPLDASRGVPLVAASDLVVDRASTPPTLYVAESGLHRVRRFQLVDPDDASTWTTDVLPLDEDPGVVVSLAVDADDGSLYLGDRDAHVVRRTSRGGGALVVVAGRPHLVGDAGDDGRATEALLDEPAGLVVDSRAHHRALFIADSARHRVRKVELDGAGCGDGVVCMHAVLGNGTAGSDGEGAPASAFSVAAPRGLAVDEAGNLFVTSRNAVRFVQASTFSADDAHNDPATADGFDDVRTIYGAAPRAQVPASVTRCLGDVELAPADAHGARAAFAVDTCLGVVIRLDRAVP